MSSLVIVCGTLLIHNSFKGLMLSFRKILKRLCCFTVNELLPLNLTYNDKEVVFCYHFLSFRTIPQTCLATLLDLALNSLWAVILRYTHFKSWFRL